MRAGTPLLPPHASFEGIALNRVTFGARESDIASAKRSGWNAWVEQQLHPPSGDDPELKSFLDGLVMPIKYNGLAPAKGIPGWPPVDERRPLHYLKQSVADLWMVPRNVETSIAADEFERIQEELNAATWVRNMRSVYQLREVMVDFWNNHFNIGRQADMFAAAALPVYDAQVIRPRAFGNFYDMLMAVAASASMLRYLDNAASTAAHPNENYAREILELHTLGRGAYLGLSSHRSKNAGVASGFTDDDIVEVSRALSGWTLEQGQDGPDGKLAFTGQFVFNPVQHNPSAGMFMGVDLSAFRGEAQGRAVLETIAHHPVTAEFICTKIARRLFGDHPPPTVIARAKQTWLASRQQPDQIGRVLSAILTGGDEIGLPPDKCRRPYERIIAFFRTTDIMLSAFVVADIALAPLMDGLYVWPTPEGRPESNSQWRSAMTDLYSWNFLPTLIEQPSVRTRLLPQVSDAAKISPEGIVTYWVGRMIGHSLRPSGMSVLIADASGVNGAFTAYKTGDEATIEAALRRLVVLIAGAPEFGVH